MENTDSQKSSSDKDKKKKESSEETTKNKAMIDKLRSRRRTKRQIIIYTLFLIAAIIIIILWWIHYSHYITTTDANIASNRVNIASSGNGIIESIFINEQDSISVGDTLFSVKTENNLTLYVTAPITGNIAKVWLLTGDMARNGQTVVTVNEKSAMWINVYLEETKLSNIYLNQSVEMRLLAYPDLRLYGKIFYIGQDTASQFTLIAVNNAAGNYTRVTQRIQLKVSIDSISGKENYNDSIQLISGLSAKVMIERQKHKRK